MIDIHVTDRLEVLIRERLVLFQRCTNQTRRKITVPAVLKEIDRVLEDNGLENSAVTERSLYPSLSLERRRRSPAFNREVGFFLRKIGQIHGSEFSCDPAEEPEPHTLVAGEHSYRLPRWKRLFSNIEGEYYFEGEHTDGATFTHLIAYQSGESGGLYLDRRDSVFRKAPFEAELSGPLKRREEGELDLRPTRGGAMLILNIRASEHYACPLEPLAPGLPGLKFAENPAVGDRILATSYDDKPFIRLANLEQLPFSVNSNIIIRNIKTGGYAHFIDISSRYILDEPIIKRMNGSSGASIFLIEAAKAGDANGMVRAIVDGADINFQDEGGMTARHWAAHNALAVGCELTTYAQPESSELAALLDSLEDPLSARTALVAASRDIDLLVKDDLGCYASTHVLVGDSDWGRFKLVEHLTQQEYAVAKSTGQKYSLIPPRGTPCSPLGYDPWWDEEVEPSAPLLEP